MRLIIAGSRDITDRAHLAAALDSYPPARTATEIVSGGARGADALGEEWARSMGLVVTRFPADWDTYGKSAGPRRNRDMAYYADALLALWDGQSRGTRHMIETMRELRKPVHVHLCKGGPA